KLRICSIVWSTFAVSAGIPMPHSNIPRDSVTGRVGSTLVGSSPTSGFGSSFDGSVDPISLLPLSVLSPLSLSLPFPPLLLSSLLFPLPLNPPPLLLPPPLSPPLDPLSPPDPSSALT